MTRATVTVPKKGVRIEWREDWGAGDRERRRQQKGEQNARRKKLVRGNVCLQVFFASFACLRKRRRKGRKKRNPSGKEKTASTTRPSCLVWSGELRLPGVRCHMRVVQDPTPTSNAGTSTHPMLKNCSKEGTRKRTGTPGGAVLAFANHHSSPRGDHQSRRVISRPPHPVQMAVAAGGPPQKANPTRKPEIPEVSPKAFAHVYSFTSVSTPVVRVLK